MNESAFDCMTDAADPQANLTELRRLLIEANALIHAERQTFHAMADTLIDVVFSTLPDGSWDYVNARICDATSLTVQTALGDGWTKAIHPDDIDRVLQEFQSALQSGTPFESSFRLHCPQGTFRRFVGQAHPLRDDSGRIVRWAGSAVDVDELLTAEDALAQATRKNQADLAKLAHDLRNIVAPIANSSAILRNPKADAAQRQRSLEIIDRQIRELRAVLDRIQASALEAKSLPDNEKASGDVGLLKQASRRVLLVASDGDFADDWSMLLRVAGHEVCVASGMQQAEDLAQTFTPEVLAVSLPLPEDNDEWPPRLRSQSALAAAFLVAIAPDPAALSAGWDAVLRKPVQLQDFLRILSQPAAKSVRKV